MKTMRNSMFETKVEQKELGNNVIMSIYRGDRW